MKTSAFVAVVIALVVIQMVNAQDSGGTGIVTFKESSGEGNQNEPTRTSNSTTNATSTCKEVMCKDGCERVLDPDGCPICDCQTNCADINCTKDEECVLEVVECKRDPCFPRPTCVPRINVSCTGTPNTSICSDFNDTQYRWSFNASTHSCQRFRYYGCTPSPNTFTTREACMDKCKSSNVCEVCLENCYTFKKKDGTTNCICPDPCKDFNCTVAGEVCRLIDVACAKPPCNATLEPSCVKNPCLEPEPCGLQCLKSFKIDDNGCQLCECCDQYKPPKPIN